MLTKDKHKSTWKWTKKAKILSTAPFNRLAAKVIFFTLQWWISFASIKFATKKTGRKNTGKRKKRFRIYLDANFNDHESNAPTIILHLKSWKRKPLNLLNRFPWMENYSVQGGLVKMVRNYWRYVSNFVWSSGMDHLQKSHLSFILCYDFLSLFVWNEDTEKKYSSSIKVCSWTFCLMVQF